MGDSKISNNGFKVTIVTEKEIINEWVAVLICVNRDGTKKLRLLTIGKILMPLCFKIVEHIGGKNFFQIVRSCQLKQQLRTIRSLWNCKRHSKWLINIWLNLNSVRSSLLYKMKFHTTQLQMVVSYTRYKNADQQSNILIYIYING